VVGALAICLAEAADTPPPEAEEVTGEASLSPEHRRFLEEAAPLLSETEREAFLTLSREYQRSAFIRQFWRVRDPFPATARNELLDAWEQRLELARTRYESLTDERARKLLLYGEPGEVVPVRCSDLLKTLEVWAYRGGFGTGAGFHLVFYRWGGRDQYRLWSPRDGLQVLLADTTRGGITNLSIAQAIAEQCFRGEQLLQALNRALDPEAGEGPVRHPGDEWLRTFLAASTDLPEGAENFSAELGVSYPGRNQNRTVVQGVVRVDPAELTPTTDGGVSLLVLLLDGEVLRDGELFESFRYRFQFPVQVSATDGGGEEKLPLAFERYLRPGDYRLVIRAQDLTSGRYYREERPLTVPAVVSPSPAPPAEIAAGLPALPGSPPVDPLAEANATLVDSDSSLRLLPPASGLLTGNTRIEARVSGAAVSRVQFLLNDRQVMSKRSPPYSVELHLGEAPRLHRVTAIALDAGGREVARDELQLNAGPHRFAVRLVEPARNGKYRHSLRARAEVEVPEGEVLDRVEFYLNDTLLATLYQPPFVQPVVLPPGEEITYVRALAFLSGGTSSEDLVFVNSPRYLEEVEVQFVELFTTVTSRRGRPVEGLARGDFRVLEDGVEQEIRRFERVTDVPIYAGVILDTSASMAEEISDAVRAALKFFETVITPKDRAAVITFNDRYNLAVRFTNNPEVLAGGVAGLVAEGETNLYDCLVYSLYYFSGVKGKRALILLSDGEDVSSRYTFEDVLDYARRTGVAVYTIGLGLPAGQKDIQIKLSRLADETGGRTFLIDRVNQLEQVYRIIEEELRSQYLLAYQSSQTGDKFRTIEVQVVGHPGIEAKTLRGYYP
jgi:VWFA-related protein